MKLDDKTKLQLKWIVKYEMAEDGLGGRFSADVRQRAIMSSIVYARLERILSNIEIAEENGYSPIGTLAQARRELGLKA